jgi:hypothetical protein
VDCTTVQDHLGILVALEKIRGEQHFEELLSGKVLENASDESFILSCTKSGPGGN